MVRRMSGAPGPSQNVVQSGRILLDQAKGKGKFGLLLRFVQLLAFLRLVGVCIQPFIAYVEFIEQSLHFLPFHCEFHALAELKF